MHGATDRRGHRPGRVRLRRLCRALYDTQTLERLPAAVDAALEGDRTALQDLADEADGLLPGDEDPGDPLDQFGVEGIPDDAEGVYWTTECHEEAPFTRFDAPAGEDPLVAALEDEVVTTQATCAALHITPAGVREDEVVHSDVPALVLVGEFDPITPPAFARLAAQGLPGAQVVVVADAGHAVLDAGECATTMVAMFLERPSDMPDRACAG